MHKKNNFILDIITSKVFSKILATDLPGNFEEQLLIRTAFRSSHGRYSVRIGVLINFAKFTRKHLCQSLFFNKFAGRPATKFLRAPF